MRLWPPNVGGLQEHRLASSSSFCHSVCVAVFGPVWCLSKSSQNPTATATARRAAHSRGSTPTRRAARATRTTGASATAALTRRRRLA
eukprot:gene1013-biopygen21235